MKEKSNPNRPQIEQTATSAEHNPATITAELGKDVGTFSQTVLSALATEAGELKQEMDENVACASNCEPGGEAAAKEVPDNDEVSVRLMRVREEQQRTRTQFSKSKRDRLAAADRRDYEAWQNAIETPGLLEFCANRILDPTDFSYLFQHRFRLGKRLREDLEIINKKIMHTKKDGEDGYWKKYEQDIGWTEHICPIAWARTRQSEKLVRCGLWSNPKNGGRCHLTDLCPFCLWLDILKDLAFAYSPKSGAFAKAPLWTLITLGYTTNPNNAKCHGGDFDKKAFDYIPGGHDYDPYPISLGCGSGEEASDAWLAYDDARILASIQQQAVGQLYKERIFQGFRNKIEGAYGLFPGNPNRLNLHGHTVANGAETNLDFIATELRNAMVEGLAKYRSNLQRRYFHDVQVLQIKSQHDLYWCVKYLEKIIPVGVIVQEALARPEAKLPNGNWNKPYIDLLQTSLMRLLGEDIPDIFQNLKFYPEFRGLSRRKTVGNMRFGSKDFIGFETMTHYRKRKRNRLRIKKKRSLIEKEPDNIPDINCSPVKVKKGGLKLGLKNFFDGGGLNDCEHEF